MTTETTLRQGMRIGIFVLMLCLPFLAQADAGKIMFVLGQASVIDGSGTEKAARKGLPLAAGDRIVTSRSGQVQVRMADGGLIAVRPDSEFRIDDFEFKGDAKSDKTFYSLVKGGFRSVTGAVGEANKQSYKVTTPVATIGIRGTDYTARLCASDCQDNGVTDGLYIGVMSGGVVVNNDVGTVEVDPGEYGFVQDAVSLPQLMDNAPNNVLFAKVDSGADSGTEVASAESSSEGAIVESDDTGISSNTTESQVVAFAITSSDGADLANAQNDSTTVVEETNPPVVSDNTDTTQTTEPTPPVYVRNILASIGGATTLGSNTMESTTVGTSANGALTSFTVNHENATQVTYTGETGLVHEEYATDSVTGISWGRWTGDVQQSDMTGTNTLTHGNSIHWIASADYENDVYVPLEGSATYVLAGGTAPTDNYGTIGSFTGTNTIHADFANQNVDVMLSVSTEHPYFANFVVWEGSTVDTPIVNGGFSDTLTVSTANSDTGLDSYFSNQTGTITGKFTGSSDPGMPNGIMSAYEMSLNDGMSMETIKLNGVAAYQIDPATVQ